MLSSTSVAETLIPQDGTDLPPQPPVENFPAVFRYDHDVVLTLPKHVGQALPLERRLLLPAPRGLSGRKSHAFAQRLHAGSLEALRVARPEAVVLAVKNCHIWISYIFPSISMPFLGTLGHAGGWSSCSQWSRASCRSLTTCGCSTAQVRLLAEVIAEVEQPDVRAGLDQLPVALADRPIRSVAQNRTSWGDPVFSLVRYGIRSTPSSRSSGGNVKPAARRPWETGRAS